MRLWQVLLRVCLRVCSVLAVALWLGAGAQAQPPSLLDRARAEAAAGRLERASELYRQLLEGEPNHTVALGELADAFESAGRWREAIPFLSRLLELEPNNAPRLFALGQMKSWQEGERADALALLKRAADLAPQNPDYRVRYAEVLSWSADHRAEAVATLRAIVASHPGHLEARRQLARILGSQQKREEALATLEPLTSRPAAEADDFMVLGQIEESSGKMSAAAAAYRKALERNPDHPGAVARLAEILSWSEATRPEAVKLFERGLALDPNNEALLVAYAEMLTWSRDSRPLAKKYFERVLAQNPANPRAIAGEAQILAWSGRSKEALALYEKILAADPSNATALRGKAEILNWSGRYTEAHELLTRARELAPDDPGTLVELARANAGLRRYTEAHDYLARVQGVGGPEFDALQREINRGLGTYMELGFGLRRNRRRLDFYRMEALLSTPLGSAHRMSARFRPTLFQTGQRDFNSNQYALSLDSQLSENVASHAEIVGESYPGAPPQMDGTLGVRYRVRRSFLLDLGFERRAVDETLVSTRGLVSNGLFLGQVRSNLASLGGSYSNAEHHFDISVTYTDGVYTGRNLDSNRRWAVDLNIGKSLRGDRPYLRIAYGFTYLSFDHDADFLPGTAPPRISGGYFSPTRFFLNYGSLYMSHRFGRKLEWDGGGTLGVQNVETTTSSLSNSQFASTFSTHLVWHVDDSNDLRIGYDFLNVFAAFRRNMLRITWRHYF